MVTKGFALTLCHNLRDKLEGFTPNSVTILHTVYKDDQPEYEYRVTSYWRDGEYKGFKIISHRFFNGKPKSKGDKAIELRLTRLQGKVSQPTYYGVKNVDGINVLTPAMA